MHSVIIQLERIRQLRPSLRACEGRSVNAQLTIKKIITSASKAFSEKGHADLTLRHVAKEAGIAVGNLTYHFPSRDVLLEAVIRENLADYAEAHLERIEASDSTPLDILLDIAEYYVSSAPSSHKFFINLWSFASSNNQARQLIDEIYQPMGRFVYYLIREVNPSLGHDDIRRLTQLLFSLEAGNKLYIGMNSEDPATVQTAAEDMRSLVNRLVTM